MGLLGALALGHFGLQGPVGLRQLGRPFPDAHFQLIALALQAGFRLLEGHLRLLALDGIANGAGGLPAKRLAFDQVILNPVADGFEPHCFVRHSGQHHDGQMRRLRPRPDKRVAPGRCPAGTGPAAARRSVGCASARRLPSSFRRE